MLQDQLHNVDAVATASGSPNLVSIPSTIQTDQEGVAHNETLPFLNNCIDVDHNLNIDMTSEVSVTY